MSATGGDGAIHHVIFTYAKAMRRGSDVLVHASANGNFRAYGELIPGTVVILAEDRALGTELAAPLDKTLTPLLLPGFSTRHWLQRARMYRRARSVIRQIAARAEFIQIHHPTALGCIGANCAIAMNKPFYVDTGGTLLPAVDDGSTNLWHRLTLAYQRRAEVKMAAHARLLIAVNPHLLATFPPSDVPKVVVSHSVVEEKEIYKRDDACERADLRLFVATRMVESKGIHHLLRAVRTLIDESYDVTLQVAGTGEYLPTLKTLNCELGLESRVKFLGGVPAGEALWPYYRQADIAVLPSLGHYEGTPRMILEAWASGAPIVATTVGGIPDLVNDGQDGLLVPPGDEPGLAAAIKRIYQDRELRRRLVEHGYRRAGEMTYEGRLPILRRAFEQYLPGLLPERSE